MIVDWEIVFQPVTKRTHLYHREQRSMQINVEFRVYSQAISRFEFPTVTLGQEPRMSQSQTSGQTPALAALLYIAKKLGNPGFHKACKLLYLADKLHLSEYGRFITNDNYKAYKHGPLPTEVYEALKQERADMTQRLGFRVEMNGSEPQIFPLIEPDMDQLSSSDVEVLDETITAYAAKSFTYLSDVTHDSAWQAGRKRTGTEMTLDEIVDTLPNKEALRAYLQGEHL